MSKYKHRPNTGSNVSAIALTQGDIAALEDAREQLARTRRQRARCPHCNQEFIINFPRLGAVAALIQSLLSKLGQDVTLHWKG